MRSAVVSLKLSSAVAAQRRACVLAGSSIAGAMIAAVLGLGSAASAAEVIVNGDFESGALSPWQATGGITAGISSNGAFVPGGSRYAMIGFSTGTSGALTQSFELANAGTFDYAFRLGRTEGFGPFNDVPLTFEARIDGITLTTDLPQFDPATGGSSIFLHLGSEYAGSVALSAGLHELSFAFSRGETLFGRGPYFGLDGVTVTPQAPAGVPEPTAWALMIAGFGLVGAALRGRRGSLAA